MSCGTISAQGVDAVAARGAAALRGGRTAHRIAAAGQVRMGDLVVLTCLCVCAVIRCSWEVGGSGDVERALRALYAVPLRCARCAGLRPGR